MNIGFNFVVLLTQLNQLGLHPIDQCRLNLIFTNVSYTTGCPVTRGLVHQFTELPSGASLVEHFKEELGTIEILGKSDRIERVYFKIDLLKKQHWRTRHLQVHIPSHVVRWHGSSLIGNRKARKTFSIQWNVRIQRSSKPSLWTFVRFVFLI